MAEQEGETDWAWPQRHIPVQNGRYVHRCRLSARCRRWGRYNTGNL